MRSLLILMALSAPQAPEAEVRVVEYLKTHVKPGEHLVVSPRGAQPAVQHLLQAAALHGAVPEGDRQAADARGDLGAVRLVVIVDVERVLAHPRFGKALERTISGWEAQPAPAFAATRCDGTPLASADPPAAPRLLLVHERLAYARQQGLGFTLAHMTAETQEAFGAVSVFPTMFFVDAKGTIVKHFLNQQDKASLEAAVRLALQ